MPLSYEEVLERWDRSRAFGDPRDLPTFSAQLNEHTGTNEFDEGLRDSWWRRASTRANTEFFHPIAAVTTEPLGRAIGGLFGEEGAKVGAQAGKVLPRAIAQTVPLIAAEILSGGTATPLVAAGAASTGALFGAETYAETGSPTAATISGVTGAVLPAASRVARPWLPNLLKTTSPLATKAAGFIGGQAAQLGIGEASMFGQAKALGQPFDPLSPDFIASQIPFTAIDLVHTAIAKPTAPKAAPEPIKPPRPYEPPPSKPEETARVEGALAMLDSVLSDPQATTAQREAATAAALGVAFEPKIRPTAEAEPVVTITGRGRVMPNGNMKIFADPELSEGLTFQEHRNVFVNENEGAQISTNPDGTLTIKTPAKFVSHNVTSPLFEGDFNLPDPTQPNLPVQPKAFGGFDPDEFRTLQKHGIPTEETPHFSPLKTIASQLESTESTVADAKQKIATVPKSAEDWQNGIVYHGTPFGKFEKFDLSKRGTATDKGGYGDWGNGVYFTKDRETAINYAKQELDDPKLASDPHVVSAMVDMKNPLDLRKYHPDREKSQLKGLEYNFAEDILGDLGDNFGDWNIGYKLKQVGYDGLISADGHELVVFDPEKIQILKTEKIVNEAIKSGATPTQAVETARLVTQTPRVDDAITQQNLLREKGQTIATKPLAEPKVTSLRTPDDKPFHFESASQVQEAIDAHHHANLTDTTVWEPDVINEGKPNEYWVARKRTGGKVSLEQEQGGVSISNLIASDENLVTNLGKLADNKVEPTWVAPDSRPDVSFQDAISSLDRATKEPAVFARVIGLDASDPMDVLQATKYAKQAREIYRQSQEGELSLPKLNEALKAQGSTPIPSLDRAKTILKIVGSGIDEFNGKYRNFTLDSTVPHDPVVTKAIGIQDVGGVQKAVDWYVNHPKSGVMGMLAGVLHKNADYSKIDVTFNQQEGWHFIRGKVSGRDRINIGDLPKNEADAFGDWGQTLSHEIAHHTFAELVERSDPVAVRLRASLKETIDAVKTNAALPQKVKEAITKSFNSKWYDEYSKTGDKQEFYKKWTSVAGKEHDEWFPVFYGLQNEHELIASMYGSPEMVSILKNTRMPKQPVTILQHFSKVWNKIFGGSVDTEDAFAQLISHSDNYLSGVRIRPTREGIVAAPQELYNGRNYIRDALVASGVRPDALAGKINTVERLYQTGDLSHSIAAFKDPRVPLPATAVQGDVHPNVETAITTGVPNDVHTSTMGLLADEVPVHQELFRQMHNDLDIATKLYTNIKKGNVPGSIPENAFQNLQYARVKLNAMSKALNKQAAALQRWDNVSRYTPDGFGDTIADQLHGQRWPAPPDPTSVQLEAEALVGRDVSTVRKETSLAELKGETSGRLARTLMLTQHFARIMPHVKDVVWGVRRSQGDAIENAGVLNASYAHEPNTPGTFSKRVAESNRRVAGNATLTKAASDIYRYTNEKSKAGETWTWNDPEIKGILKGVANQKDLEAIKLEHESQVSRHLVWVNQVVPRQLAAWNQAQTARIIALRETGMLPNQAAEISGQLYDALRMIKSPQEGPAGVAVLHELSQKMTSGSFLYVLKHAQNLINSADKHLEVMRQNPDFVTEQRYDAHHLRMTRGQEQGRWQAKTKEELDTKRIALEKQGWKFEQYIPRSDANVDTAGINKRVLDSFEELDRQAGVRLSEALADKPELLSQVLPETQRTAEYKTSLVSYGPLPGASRRLIAGREDINMLENAHEYYTRGVNWFRHKITRAEADLGMLHPEIAGNRVLRDWSEQHVQNYLTPDNPIARKIAEVTYFTRLGFDLGNTMLESVQSLTTGLQSIISESGSVGDAFALTARAAKEIASYVKTKKWSIPELDDYMDYMARRGEQALTTYDDIIDLERETVYSINRRKGKPLSQAASALQNGARKWATVFQRYNNRVGLVAGYFLAKERGMSFDEMTRFGIELKDRGAFTGGKAQRPVGLWSIKSKPVPQMLSALQTYTLGWYGLMAENYRIGFGKNNLGYSAKQISGAKKGFIYGLAAQSALAGAFGLPGVGQGMALLQQGTGLDLKGWLRSHMAEMFGEDQESGGIMTNMGLRGVLAGVSPLDPSNRASLSIPFTGVDPYKGFDLGTLAGAPGSTVSDFVQGLMAMAKGDRTGFEKLLPNALKRPVRLWLDEGDVRDSRGALQYKLSPSERFLQAIGVGSSRVQQARDTGEAVRKLNDAAIRQKEHQIDEWARMTRKGQVSQAHAEMLKYLEAHPEANAQGLVQSIATRVERQTTPYDYRRDLNPGASIKGFGATQPSSEVAALNTRLGVEQSFGLFRRPNPHTAALAQQLDSLMNSNPFLSRSEAMRQVSGTRPSRHRYSVLGPEEYQ